MANSERQERPKDNLAELARAQATAKAPAPGGTFSTKRKLLREKEIAPRWYRVVVPLLFALGGVLMVIGLWAAGAMMYMRTVTPTAAEDVKYPLLQWSDEAGSAGGYSHESQVMAMTMLACIPLAMVMGAIVIVLRRQIRVAKHRDLPLA
jgi:hypothetical protein